MFFRKKYHTLDRGLLAEALSIYSGKITFDRQYHTINETISLNDVLRIKIHLISYHHGEYAHFYHMIVSTYVEDIKMAEYRFDLDLDANKELYRRWECKEKEIMHYMPNKFIDLMNEWSKKIVSDFKEEQNRIKQKRENSRQKKYNREEDILKKYR